MSHRHWDEKDFKAAEFVKQIIPPMMIKNINENGLYLFIFYIFGLLVCNTVFKF